MRGTYLRIDSRLRGERQFVSKFTNEAIVFVDIIADDGWSPTLLTEMLRDFRFRAMPDMDCLVVRLPDRIGGRWDNDRSAQFANALRSHPVVPRTVHTGVMNFAAGAEPSISWGGDPYPVPESQLVKVCRSLEIEALAAWGNAVWEPSGYHFQLPSGRHDGAFVKVADLVRSDRDADVLASWLCPWLGSTRAILSDTGSLAAVLVAAKAIQERAGLPAAQVYSLDTYPRSELEARFLLRQAAAMGTPLTMMVSVAASGRLSSHLAAAAERELGADGWNLIHVIDRSGGVLAGEEAHVHSWHTLPADRPVVTVGCAFCADPRRSRVVQIDPRSLGTILLPRPTLIMPDVSTALSNREFWKTIDDAGSIEVEVPPAAEAANYRPRGELMGARVELASLAGSDEFRALVSARCRLLASGEAKALPIWPQEPRSYDDYKSADLLLLTSQGEHYRTAFTTALESLGVDVPERVAEYSDGAPLELEGVKRLIIAAPGFVTGNRMRRLMLAVRDLSASGQPPIVVAGLVLHARPESLAEWQSTFNSYERRLHAIWFTGLPLASPLRSEAQLLTQLNAKGAFVESRRRLFDSRSWPEKIDESTGTHQHLLWCASKDRPQLRGESIYGSRLSEIGTFFAVGSAVAHARMKSRHEDPHGWAMFDLGKIVGSYYDAIIFCSILRWLDPGEIWWGGSTSLDGDAAALQTVERLFAMTTEANETSMLVPELYRAIIAGQVPRSVMDLVDSAATSIIDETGALEFARQLAKQAT